MEDDEANQGSLKIRMLKNRSKEPEVHRSSFKKMKARNMPTMAAKNKKWSLISGPADPDQDETKSADTSSYP
jgi:hypothetical protein